MATPTNLDTLILSVPLGAASMSGNVAVKQRSHILPTIPTTGAVEILFRAPCAGMITGASFTGKDALAQAAAIVTFTIVNKGQANAGTAAVLAVSDANTTKTSTGAAIAAYTPFPLTLNATPANLVVAKGDVLTFVATVSGGTLANTVTEGVAVIEFTPS